MGDHVDERRFCSGAVRSSDADSEKYGDFNWERGMPIHDLLNHGLRHLYLFLSGDRSEDHLAHAGWNVLAAMHSEELWPELNEDHLRRDNCVAPAANGAYAGNGQPH